MNDIFSIVLFFGSPEFVILLSILGIYFGERQLFLNTLLIAFFGMLITAYLKSVFQVPLNPEIGKIGWAYPSGHTMFDVIFWGALFIQIRKPWVLFAGLVISIAAFFGMVYKRYHNWEEILGGICSGGLVLVAFYYWIQYRAEKTMSLLAITLIVNLAIYNFLLPHELMDYKWLRIVIGIHIGIGMALPYLEKLIPKCVFAKIMAFILAVVSTYLIRAFLHINDFIVGATISLIVLMLIPGAVRYIESKMKFT